MLWIPELILAAFAVFLVRRLRQNATEWESTNRVLAGRAPLVAAALLSAAVTWTVWRSLNDVGTVHDEVSYLLQAQIFAHGKWTEPAAPIPAFFEQFHVFTDPVIASKYPPGHSLLLVPGIWLGLPGLVPLLLVAACGALIFALARRVSNSWVALLTFCLWLLGRTELRFHSSYFSENTTTLCWLLGFWALLEFRERREARWLALVTACVAWGGITRPLTMVAYAIPTGLVVIWTLTRYRAWHWRTIAPAAAIGAAIVGIVFVSNAKVTGSWRSMPWNVWSREYMPWDVPGFGLDTTPPRRELSPVMSRFAQQFGGLHKNYTIANLPSQTWARLSEISESSLGTWRRPDVRTLLAPFAIIGLILLAVGRPIREGPYALACAVALFVSYLSYAHPPPWTLYYLESSWLLPFAASLGLWMVTTMIVQRVRAPSAALLHEVQRLPTFATAALVGALLWFAIPRINGARQFADLSHNTLRSWRNFVNSAIPDRRAILFVRYAPWHYVHESLVANDPDLASARLWIVYDRGAEDAKLAALAPDRATYLFDEKTRALSRLGSSLARR
ncbi:MAG TPA: hypothetical protein VGH98_20510 [Gemmatimonadaceae bacterium]|jgi:hypothetical protein